MGDEIIINSYSDYNSHNVHETAEELDGRLETVEQTLDLLAGASLTPKKEEAFTKVRAVVLNSQNAIRRLQAEESRDLRRISEVMEALPLLIKAEMDREDFPAELKVSDSFLSEQVETIKRAVEERKLGTISGRTTLKTEEITSRLFATASTQKPPDNMEKLRSALTRIQESYGEIKEKIRAHGPVEPVGAKFKREQLREIWDDLWSLTNDPAQAEADGIDPIATLRMAESFLILPDQSLGLYGTALRTGNTLEAMKELNVNPKLLEVMEECGSALRDQVDQIATNPDTTDEQFEALHKILHDFLLAVRNVKMVYGSLARNGGKVEVPQFSERLKEAESSWLAGDKAGLGPTDLDARSVDKMFADLLGKFDQRLKHARGLRLLSAALKSSDVDEKVCASVGAAIRALNPETVATDNTEMRKVLKTGGLLLSFARLEKKILGNLEKLKTNKNFDTWTREYVKLVMKTADAEGEWAKGNFDYAYNSLPTLRKEMGILSQSVATALAEAGIDQKEQTSVHFASGSGDDENVYYENERASIPGDNILEVPKSHPRRVNSEADQANANRLAKAQAAITEEKMKAAATFTPGDRESAKQAYNRLVEAATNLEEAFEASVYKPKAFEDMMEAEIEIIEEAFQPIIEAFPDIEE